MRNPLAIRARTLLVIMFIIVTFVIPQAARAQGNCPGVNGNDEVPDDEFIQACLDAGPLVVVLDADVSRGYFIADGLVLRRSGTTLTATSNFGYRALLWATPGLSRPLLETDGYVSNFVLSNLLFHGNKYQRDGVFLCAEANR